MGIAEWVTVAGIVSSASLAVWALARAHTANKIAKDALEVQRAAMPPEWSAAEYFSDEVVAFTNTSSRRITVVGITAEPDSASSLVRAEPRPFDVEYGDRLPIEIESRYTLSPQYVTITWRYADAPSSSAIATRRKL